MGRNGSETKLSQDPEASECTSINPRVPRDTLREDWREGDESRTRERKRGEAQ